MVNDTGMTQGVMMSYGDAARSFKLCRSAERALPGWVIRQHADEMADAVKVIAAAAEDQSIVGRLSSVLKHCDLKSGGHKYDAELAVAAIASLLVLRCSPALAVDGIEGKLLRYQCDAEWQTAVIAGQKKEITSAYDRNDRMRLELAELKAELASLKPQPDPKPTDNAFARRRDGRAPDRRES